MTLYEKRGRRYYPIAESDLPVPFYNGTYVLRVQPGYKSTTSIIDDVDPDIIAKLWPLRERLMQLLSVELRGRPQSRELSEREQKAIAAYREIMGDAELIINYDSINDMVHNAIVGLAVEMKRRIESGGIDVDDTFDMGF